MNTFNYQNSKIFASLALVGSLAFSCASNDAERPAVQKTSAEQLQAHREASAAENTQMVSAAMDVFEQTSAALVAKGVAGGRVAYFGSRTSGDAGCLPGISGTFSVVSTNADSSVYQGTLLLDFGTGMACEDSTKFHKGLVTDVFKLVLAADDVNYTLTETVTFTGFEKDSVKIDGKFIGISSPGKTAVKVENAKLTYADGTSASLNANLFSTHAGSPGVAGSKEVSGSLAGVSRDGIAFSAVTINTLIYDYSCSPNIPVSGSIDMNIGGVTSELDYGTGLCDNHYELTTNDSITVNTFNYAGIPHN